MDELSTLTRVGGVGTSDWLIQGLNLIAYVPSSAEISSPIDLAYPTGGCAEGPPQLRLRSEEADWRRTHPEMLQPYEGQWVVLEKNKIIVSGTDVASVLAQAKGHGIPSPYIFYVEPAQTREGDRGE